jgi:TusE/DsrC/DsvC family sulfur relay protein
MGNISVAGVTYELLPDGRLANSDDWSEDVAASLAEKDGITLTHNHWEIINLMRDFYKQYNISPIRKLLIKTITEKYDEKKAHDEYLESLFPNGVLIEGSKIAGIPMPMLDAEMSNSNRHNQAVKRAAKSRVDPSLVNHFIDKFDYDGNIYEVTEKGNLKDSSQWSEEIAGHMASKEGITLGNDHWEVINYLRKFYFEYGMAPMVKLLMKYMKEQCGPEKSSEDYLYKLFPQGPSRQGCRLGGLPEPQGCID